MNAPSNETAVSLGYVIFYVRDVAKTVAFWQAAFGLTLKFAHEGGDYAELATGATTLAFASDALMMSQGLKYRTNLSTAEPSGAQVSLTTGDPQALVTRAVQSGAKLVKAVEQKPWGQWSGFVTEENGILVEVCTVVE